VSATTRKDIWNIYLEGAPNVEGGDKLPRIMPGDPGNPEFRFGLGVEVVGPAGTC
jgi:hypothetical protein